MKNIFRIYTSDMKKIVTSWVTLVIVAGLTILPPLYAWINIYASWDPYSNTAGLQVAVVNEDKGIRLGTVGFDIGSEVMNSLKTNDKVGWVFCDDRGTAMKLAQNGEVYAAIVIPADFSDCLTTVLNPEPTKPTLQYYVNEKENAIAPKMTDAVVTTLQKQITESILGTAFRTAVSLLDKAGIKVEGAYEDIKVNLLEDGSGYLVKISDQYDGIKGSLSSIGNQLSSGAGQAAARAGAYITALDSVKEQLPQLESHLNGVLDHAQSDGKVQLEKTDEQLRQIQKTVASLSDLGAHFSEALLAADAQIKENSPEIKENLLSAQSMFYSASDHIGKLADTVETKSPQLANDINTVAGEAAANLAQMQGDVLEIADTVTRLSDRLENGSTKDEVVQACNTVASDLAELSAKLEEAKKKTSNVADLKKSLAILIRAGENLYDDIADLKLKIDNRWKEIDNRLARLQAISEAMEGLISQIRAGASGEDIESKTGQILGDLQTLSGQLEQSSGIYASVVGVLEELEDQLEQIRQSAGSASGFLERLRSLSRELTGQISDVRVQLMGIRSEIVSQIKFIHTTMNAVVDLMTDLYRLIPGQTDIRQEIDDITAKLDLVSGKLTDSAEKLSNLQTASGKEIAERATETAAQIGRIEEKLKGIQIDGAVSVDGLYEAQGLCTQAEQALGKLATNLDSNIVPKISSYLTSGEAIVSETVQVMDGLQPQIEMLSDALEAMEQGAPEAADRLRRAVGVLPAVSEGIGRVQQSLGRLHEQTEFRDILNALRSPSFADQMGIDDLIQRIKNNGTFENMDLEQMIRYLRDNVSIDSDFLAAPVAVDHEKIYEMPNYGTGLTPFYTVLALWVGALFLAALLTTKAKNVSFAYTPRQEFLGKYMVFGSIAAVQGLISALGDLFLLHVQPHNPVLFVVLAVFYSIVFSMIVYSLVCTLGNVGKAAAILMMLLQITGSGGTFPIQVTPPFFQAIHNLLPFTYAMGAVREAIYGVVFDALVKDIGILLLYFVLFLLLGLFLKKPLNKFLARFTKQLHQSNVMEH